MKYVFVNRFFYPDISATSQMLTDAAFYLSDRGHEIHVVTSRLTYEGGEGLAARETVHGVVVHRIWTTRFGRGNLIGRAFDYLSFYISVYFVLLRSLRRDDMVVAKTDPPMVSVPVGWAARIKKAKQVNWLQDLFPEVAEELGLKLPVWVFRLLYTLRDQSLRSAVTNIAIGELMRNRLLKLGVYTDAVSVVPNWADENAIRPIETKGNALREEWGLENRFVVGYSGNLGRAHELDTLLVAIERLKEHPDIVFLFIGSGALMDQLKQVVAERGLGNVLFKPYQRRERLNLTLGLPDLHLTMLRCSMEGLIVPSKIYGVLAAGKPSIFIGDPHGEVANLLADSDTGIAVREGDCDTLVGAIRTLFEDSQRLAEMGQNARSLCDQKLGMQRSMERLERALC